MNRSIRIVVTAGPTRAFIDPVRYISNLSTGRMGYEIARQAVSKNLSVTLISGLVHLEIPRGVRFISVETVGQLERAVMKEVKSADILIMTAAVNDYVPIHVIRKKLRRKQKSVTLKLRRTNDIVARVGRLKVKPILVGFSLETERLAEFSRAKMKRKNLDLIVGNQYSGTQNPFGENSAAVLIMDRNGNSFRMAKKPKRIIAKRVLDEALVLLKERY